MGSHAVKDNLMQIRFFYPIFILFLLLCAVIAWAIYSVALRAEPIPTANWTIEFSNGQFTSDDQGRWQSAIRDESGVEVLDHKLVKLEDNSLFLEDEEGEPTFHIDLNRMVIRTFEGHMEYNDTFAIDRVSRDE